MRQLWKTFDKSNQEILEAFTECYLADAEVLTDDFECDKLDEEGDDCNKET